MTIQPTRCDCCRNAVDVVGTGGLCCACHLTMMVRDLIAEHSRMGEDAVVALTRTLHAPILRLFIQRLLVPGQEHPLALELEQWLAPRPTQRH